MRPSADEKGRELTALSWGSAHRYVADANPAQRRDLLRVWKRRIFRREWWLRLDACTDSAKSRNPVRGSGRTGS